ncbi:MAG: hypothetical protein JWM41_3674 [Gemmatimonadetes bacterium]|nr:hypothetical protein [Gemmatimonadota bacterium]
MRWPYVCPNGYPVRGAVVPPRTTSLLTEDFEMAKTQDDRPQGAQTHAEGQHGDKTRAAFIEGLHGKQTGGDESDAAPQGSNDFDEFGQPKPGRHRLTEDRQQHDPAEKNSEANRLGG